MSEYLYWVNPANTDDIYRLRKGGQGFDPATANPPSAQESISPIPHDADPALNLYDEGETVDNPPADYSTRGQYYAVDLNRYVFNSGNQVVDVVTTYTRVSIDQLKIFKENELGVYLRQQFQNYADVRANANWKLSQSPSQRDWIAAVVGRLADQHWKQWDAFLMTPGDLNTKITAAQSAATYWQRDVPISGLNVANGKRLVLDVDQDSWSESVLQDGGVGDYQRLDAQQLVQNSINTEHSQDDWEGLADIDVRDPSWGWPALYQDPAGSTRAL